MADGPEAASRHGFMAELKRRRVIRALVLYAVGWGDRAWIEHDTDLGSLHDNPRFAALLARIR